MVNRGRLPSSPIKSRVRESTTEYEVTRTTKVKGDMGVVTDGESSTHTADLWVHSPNESVTQTVGGERTDASLVATMLPNEDFGTDDRLTYGGVVYEAGGAVFYPSESNKVVKEVPLVRMTVVED